MEARADGSFLNLASNRENIRRLCSAIDHRRARHLRRIRVHLFQVLMRRLTKLFLALGTVASIVLLTVARPAGAYLTSQLGPKILAIGKGKISDAGLFISGRLFEAGLLLGLAILLVIACTYLFRKVTARRNGWAPLAVCVFFACNLWLFAAAKTGLFWISLYTGSATSNLTQFSFKKELLDEHRTPRQAILLGSIQTQAQIDENVLNNRLQGKL